MRFLFVTAAFTGHYNPLVPLGWAARAGGHDVIVASHPSFAKTITCAGLPALPVGRDIEPFTFLSRGRGRPNRSANGNDRGPAGFRRAAEGLAELMAPDAADFARSWRPQVVVYEPMALAGPLLGRIVGVPAVRHLWTMDFTGPSNDFARDMEGPLVTSYGFDRLPVNGDLTIDPCPPRLQIADKIPRQLIRYIPYNGPAVFPAWLREPPVRPRVCVTWGTTLGHLGRMAHVPQVVRALADLDVEVVVAVLDAHRGLFTDLPANVAFVGPIALDLLLPTCAAVVHQGGGGTTMTALVHGVPQLVVSSLPDQAFNARRLAAVGAGRYAPSGDRANTEEILAEARIILSDPGYRQIATELRGELLAQPTPAEVIPVLEELAAHH